MTATISSELGTLVYSNLTLIKTSRASLGIFRLIALFMKSLVSFTYDGIYFAIDWA